MSQSSLSSVVSNLVRSQMGASVSNMVTDEDLDRHVAELILKEAKRKAERYTSQGIRAYLPEPESNAPRTNKRFLSSIIRNTDDHNKTILRAQAIAAQQIKDEREEQERRDRRARAEEAAEAERLRRRGGDSRRYSSRRDRDGKRKERSREHRDDYDDDYERKRSGKSERRRSRYEEDDERERDRRASKHRRLRSTSPSTERSDAEETRPRAHRHRSLSVNDDYEGSESSRRRRRERKRPRSRSRSLSEDTRTDDHHRRKHSRRHRTDKYADRYRRSSRRSASPTRRSRSPFTLDEDEENASHQRHDADTHKTSLSSTSTDREAELRYRLKAKGQAKDDVYTSKKSRYSRSHSPDLPSKLAALTQTASSSSSRTVRTPKSPSQSPPPLPPGPPGSRIESKMDKYFESSYDPRLDIAPPEIPATGLIDDAQFEGWDAMLRLIELRRQDKVEKKWLEKHGLSTDVTKDKKKKVEKGPTNERWTTDTGPSIMDIEYKKRGAIREWDLCKESPT